MPTTVSAAATPSAVDAHHHLWDPADGGHGWLGAPGLEVLRRPFTTTDLHHAVADGVDGRAVTATVLVQALADAAETRRLLAAAAAEPLVAGVVGWVDLTGDVAAQLAALRAAPGGRSLVGVRHLVQDEPDPAWLLRDDVLRGLRALADAGLAYDVLVRAPQRDAGVEAARRVEGLRVVLDHVGKPDLTRDAPRDALATWAVQVRRFAALGSSVCKVSGLVTEADPDASAAQLRPAWDVLLDAFGPHRLVFGSDWPVCLLRGSWGRWADTAAELAADLPAAERDALFGGTARATYTLPEQPEEA